MFWQSDPREEGFIQPGPKGPSISRDSWQEVRCLSASGCAAALVQGPEPPPARPPRVQRAPLTPGLRGVLP